MGNDYLKKAEDMSAQYTGFFLLNCYCREIAVPGELISYIYPDDYKSFGLEYQGEAQSECFVSIQFPFSSAMILLAIEKPSATCNYAFLSDPYLLDTPLNSSLSGVRCEDCDWEKIPVLIISELSRRYSVDEQLELLIQIESSRSILTQILNYHLSRPAQYLSFLKGRGADDFIDSEVSLIYGHSFHPAPKSRQGMSDEELISYSPEFKQAFSLHYFAVKPEFIATLGDLSKEAVSQLVQKAACLASAEIPEGHLLLPCHPWQAKYLLSLPAVEAALKQEKLHYLGAKGLTFNSTASVRTVFHQDFDYFLKLSLSMRITNSVRKNAYYELETAVVLNQVLQPVIQALADSYPSFSVLAEPIALTVDFPELPEDERLDLQSHFGVIFRDNPFCECETENLLLSGAVFADSCKGESVAAVLLKQFSQRFPQLNATDSARLWFQGYVRQLLPPLLSAFFKFGVAFEPHLQNVLLRIENDAVVGVVLRDMEGTKLDGARWSHDRLPEINARARSSMCHDRSTAWRRVMYCLLVNNLSQAVHSCSRGLCDDSVLWELVRTELEKFIQDDGSQLCRELLGSLLNGEAIPGKANLITRFKQSADSQADYICVSNPLFHDAFKEQNLLQPLEAASS